MPIPVGHDPDTVLVDRSHHEQEFTIDVLEAPECSDLLRPITPPELFRDIEQSSVIQTERTLGEHFAASSLDTRVSGIRIVRHVEPSRPIGAPALGSRARLQRDTEPGDGRLQESPVFVSVGSDEQSESRHVFAIPR